jgi:hypothetical protein
MSNHSDHNHHHNHTVENHKIPVSRLRLSTSATVHCLLGCGLGEVVGMIIGTALLLSTVNTIILAVSLGFVFGLALGILPLIRAKFSFKRALKQIFVAEVLSIAVMETAEVLVQIYVPGVMESGLTSPIFWGGMILALIAGFTAAFPVNYYLVGKGVRHIH